MGVYLLALGAALLFGLGSVIQQRVASVAPPGKSLRPGLLLWLVRQPVWLAGLGTGIVGNVLSASALGMSSVALVQPLLVARLLFALPLAAVWVRQRLSLRDWGGMLATAGGLAIFIALGRPRESGTVHPGLLQWAVVIALIVGLTAALVVFARRLGPAREATMLGAGAGMIFALQSAFTHSAVGGLFGGNFFAFLANWTIYAVAVAAITANLLNQSAFEMAPLTASYPALAAVEPLAAIGIGIGIFGTTLTSGVLPLSIGAAALGGMTLGIYLLATSPLVTAQRGTMQHRQAEDIVAEIEGEIDRDLHRLQSAVEWLERCRAVEPPTERPAAIRARLERIDTVLPQLDAALDRLAACGRQAAEEARKEAASTRGAGREGSGATALSTQQKADRRRGWRVHLPEAARLVPLPTREDEKAALLRYDEENRRREQALRDRAARLRERADNQRELIPAGRGDR